MDPGITAPWSFDWAWGVPLIVLTVVFHAFGLGEIDKYAISWLTATRKLQNLASRPILVIGGAAIAATLLHAFEVSVWAAVYLLLGASLDNRSAMLYSVNAMTSYGHANLYLAPAWQLLGSLEALNGWILFGLTTAYLFGVFQRALPKTTQR